MSVAFVDQITGEPEHWPVNLQEYHQDRTHESNSTLKEFLDDHWGYYLHRILGQQRDRSSHATDLGTAFHLYLSEPLRFDEQVIFLPDGVTRRSEKGKKVLLDKPTNPVLEQHDAYRLERMKSSVLSNPATAALLEGDWLIEHAVRMIHKPSGIPIKVCFDGLHATEGRIRDIKTADNPELTGDRNFLWSSWQYGYYRQGPLYCMVRDSYRPLSVFAEDDMGYDWLVVGNDEPFRAYHYRLGPATRELGQFHNDLILKKLAAYRELFEISGDPDVWKSDNFGRTVTIELPTFRFREELSL